jgi:hypothetical protein
MLDRFRRFGAKEICQGTLVCCAILAFTHAASLEQLSRCGDRASHPDPYLDRCGYTDLSRGFQGLTTLVETVLEQAPSASDNT